MKQSNWKVAVQHRWLSDNHIKILEGETVAFALRWFIQTAKNNKNRIIIFTDNTAILGALRKVRSSSPTLNYIFRRVPALSMVENIIVEYLYILSEHNPADESSRLKPIFS